MLKGVKINEFDLNKSRLKNPVLTAAKFYRCLQKKPISDQDWKTSFKVGKKLVENQKIEEIFSDTLLRIWYDGTLRSVVESESKDLG